MSDIAFEYFNQLDLLDLTDLEILSQKINHLIFNKKKSDSSQTAKGLAYFNSIKGSVHREINLKQELAEALDEKYAHSN